MAAKSDLENLKVLDRKLFKIGKRIDILNKINWGKESKDIFLNSWRKRSHTLPKIEYPKYKFTEDKEGLQYIISKIDSRHPLGKIVKETAESYLTSLRMVEAAGTKAFMKYSTKLYGLPTDKLGKGNDTTLKAARKFLKTVGKFKLANLMPPEDVCILPEYVVNKIKSQSKRTFADRDIKVITSNQLSAKASAGANRISVRSSTCFAPHDVDQLIQHELLVHTLTLQNGRIQRLKTLGLSSPRTTCTQEGLAVFAEFITNSIDISRLRRISSRVQAIQMGIEGADFIDLFRYFLKLGQSEEESFHSASRVFRGGDVRGKIVFTKDIAYLRGFIEVHHFFVNSFRNEMFSYLEYLLAGRMKTDDVAELAPYFVSKILKEPHYKPDWILNRSTLLAFLLSSSVMNNLGVR
ncbi:MAG: DUF1704 domain-containing protein [Deltaproteobacteria bacterium]|nr:DUF1704 domain-containing protein [Deltaproteobacteria bacterium]